MTLGISGPLRFAPAGFLAASLGVGVVVGVNPAAGVGLAVALVFVLVVTWDLAAGVCGFLFVTFVDVLSRDNDVTLTKAAGALLVGAWVAAMATRGTSSRDLLAAQPLLAMLVAAFLTWSAVSAVWAENGAAVVTSTVRFTLNALLFPIVLLAVRHERHVVWILSVFVAGVLLSVAWGITHDPAAGAAAAEQVGRLSGARAEANVLATMLAVGVLFAATLSIVLRRRTPPLALLAAGAAGVGLIAFFATYSRGGLVALGFMILVGVFYGGRWRPVMIVLAVIAVAVGAVYLGSSSSPAVERLTSGGTSGRSDIWTVAWRMVEANPVKGVGSGNFTTAEAHYLLEPGTIERDDLILDEPFVAHNIYLHVLAELGIVGLVLFLGALAVTLGCAVRAVALFRRRDERVPELLGRALVAGIAAILAAGFFASEQYNKQLWLLLAMCPALLAIARDMENARHGDRTA